jgi:hypothetical protein
MKKSENKQAISKSGNFIVAAMLFSLFALSGHFVSAHAQSGVWRLEAIQVFNTLGPNAVITNHAANASGGFVEINNNGNVHDLCRGGIEKLRFEWRFEFPVTQANPGGAFGVNLRGGQIAKSPQCGTAIAEISYISVLGSSGSPSPYTAQENRTIDGERFATGNGLRIWAGPDRQRSGIGSVQMKAHRAYPEHQYAFFSVNVYTRVTSGVVRYVYLYKRVG